MALFQSILTLLLLAVLLLQVSRRLRIPYPTMLAVAGVAVAALPGATNLSFDPRLALVMNSASARRGSKERLVAPGSAATATRPPPAWSDTESAVGGRPAAAEPPATAASECFETMPHVLSLRDST